MSTTAVTDIHDLIEQIQGYNPLAQVDQIRRAYDRLISMYADDQELVVALHLKRLHGAGLKPAV